MTRDLTQRQYDAAIAKYGFRRVGFLGYYELPHPYRHVSVSVFNAGPKRRAQLAYLLARWRERERIDQS